MKGHDLARNTNPAVARLTTEFLAAIEAVCAARVRDIVAIRMRGLMPPKRGRPPKLPSWPLLRADVLLFNGPLPKRGRPRKERAL